LDILASGSSERTAAAGAARVRLAVFDCDGTLVDSQSSIIYAMQAAFAAHGLEGPAPHAVRRIVGLSLETGIGQLLPQLTDLQILSVREGYREAFLALRSKGAVEEPLYPGVTQALRALSEGGWLLGVATGKSYRGLVSTLSGHDLGDHFQSLQTADRAQGKPHPEMLHNAISETGSETASTVMIGDTTFDMEMARNAGTFALGVAWGYHAVDELYAAGAHRVVHAYDDLVRTIDTLVEERP